MTSRSPQEQTHELAKRWLLSKGCTIWGQGRNITHGADLEESAQWWLGEVHSFIAFTRKEQEALNEATEDATVLEFRSREDKE